MSPSAPPWPQIGLAAVEAADLLAERIAPALKTAAGVTAGLSGLVIGVTIGRASFPEDAGDDAALIAAADRDLYRRRAPHTDAGPGRP